MELKAIADFLFEVMKMFNMVDFSVLDNLTLPQKEFLKRQIEKRKNNVKGS